MNTTNRPSPPTTVGNLGANHDLLDELMAAEQASRQRVIDSLVAGIELCHIPELERTDAARVLLEATYPDFLHDGQVDLSIPFQILTREFSIAPEKAALPCILYLLSVDDHGYEVVLPRDIQSLRDSDALVDQAEKLLREQGGYSKKLSEVTARTRDPTPRVQPLEPPTTPALRIQPSGAQGRDGKSAQVFTSLLTWGMLAALGTLAALALWR